jgi:hypothetical protein
MSAFGGTHLTMLDIARRTDPDGMEARVAEYLNQRNDMLEDIPWVESNLPTAHRHTVRTGLPTPTRRRINEGVAPTKSTTMQVDDGMQLLEDQSWTDVELLEMSANPMQTRMREGRAHIEGMRQSFAESLLYGSAADDDKEFNGIMARYDSLSGASGENILDGGGSGQSDRTSALLVGWHPETVFGIYPQNTVAGLRHKDLGEQAIPTQSASAAVNVDVAKMVAVGDQWVWKGGLGVADWRFISRIANISVADAKSIGTAASTAQQLEDYTTNLLYLMAEAYHLIPEPDMVRLCWYVNRDLYIAFDRMIIASANANVYRTQDVTGRMVMAYRGIPIKLMDQIVSDEDAVS